MCLQLLYNLIIEDFSLLQTIHFEKYKSDIHRFSSDVHQSLSRENVSVSVANLRRHDDVLITLDGYL